MISSVNNEKVKMLSKLSTKKYRDDTNRFIVEGKHLVDEASKFGLIDEIFSLNDKGTIVNDIVMKKICDTKSIVDICAVCFKPNKKEIGNKVLILDRVQDPGNVGTLIRSAVSFGFDTIILDNCADVYSPKVVRSTQGAIFKVNIIEEDIIDLIDDLKEKDYKIYGTALKNATNLQNVQKSDKLGIVLGNEGQGVRKEILDKTNYNVFIEMQNMESLNVGVAGSILMYEVSLWQ